MANCVQPPNNIDHATLTDAQLVKYGLPMRSSFRTTDDFAKAVRGMKYRDCQYTVGSPAARFGQINTTSSNWAGYYEYAGNWTTSIAEWYMNGINPGACGASYLSGRDANWGGIGGAVNNNLVQSGTVDWCDDPLSGNSSIVWYQMWVENLGDSSNPSPAFDKDYQPTPGDLMESFVGGGNGCNYMNVRDVTTGHYFQQAHGPCGDQNYFDCIEENDVYGLAVNGTVNYTTCEAYDAPQSNWLLMGHYNSSYWNDTMVNQYTDAVASSPPNQNSYGSFTVTYQNHN